LLYLIRNIKGLGYYDLILYVHGPGDHGTHKKSRDDGHTVWPPVGIKGWGCYDFILDVHGPGDHDTCKKNVGMKVTRYGHPSDNRVFYLKDHLGSTRITLASDFSKKEAIVYKPYGSEIISNEAPATDILRQRFTGKELDKEGAQFGQLNVDIKLNFALDPAKSSRMGVYFTDAPSDPLVLVAEIDPVSGYGRIRGTINYTANRTISWIHFVLNDNVSCGVQGINEQVGPGSQFAITKTATSINEFNGDKTKSFLDYARDNSYNVNGILLSYFGKRYYDAEVGKWIAVDAASQFWDRYRYTTNPIGFIDLSGLTDIWVALFNKDYSAQAVKDLNKYVRPKEGDKVVFKKFEPGQEDAMYKYLNQKGESFLDAHGNDKDPAVFYTTAAAMIGGENGRIDYSTLNTNMNDDKILNIGACFSAFSLDTKANPKLRAAAGTEGFTYLDDQLDEMYGVKFDDKYKLTHK
jgi:RHS repeat-associated protein